MNTTYEQRNYKALLTTPFALGGAGMVTAGMLFAMYLLIQVDGPEATSEPIVTIPDIFQDDIPPIEDQPRTKPKQVIEPTLPPATPTLISDNNNSVTMHGPVPVDHGDNGFTINLGESDTPIATLRTQPQYPQNAITRGIEGWVTLSFDVTRVGTTDNIQIVESEPGTTFDSAAIRALAKWKYIPKTTDGTTVRVNNMQTRLVFEMEG